MKKQKHIYVFIFIIFSLLLLCSLQTSFAITFIPADNGIQNAVNSADPGDTILLNTRVYNGNGNNNVNIYQNITIQGNGPREDIIIDSNSQGRAFMIISDNLNVTFINITFKNGANVDYGAAVYNPYNGTTLTFINCLFINNNAATSGGAIYNAGANMIVNQSTFTNNIARGANVNIGGFGGAIYNTGLNMVVDQSTFIGNNASIKIDETYYNSNAGAGGAIYNSGLNMIVNASSFTNNNANDLGNTGGGGIYNIADYMFVENSTFTNNIAYHGGGGAIYNEGDYVTLLDSTLSYGFSYNYAGALYNDGFKMTIDNCTFDNNFVETGDGGGIWSSGHNLTIINSTFTDNYAEDWGGAIHNWLGENLTIIDSTFINNTVDYDGGAIWNMGNNTIIDNCTFTDNKARQGGAIFNLFKFPENFINQFFRTLSGGYDLIIKDSTFNNNTANRSHDSWDWIYGGYGGAIFNSAPNMKIESSDFNNNSVDDFVEGDTGYGGAIYNNGTEMDVISSTFTNNFAHKAGGAIYNDADNAVVESSTFTNNAVAIYGGAIFNQGGMSVTDNTMTGNTAGELGNVIYNNGTMGNLQLTYIDNSTKDVKINSPIVLNATLTDNMGNLVTGGNIDFYVNNNYIGTLFVNEGQVYIDYTPTVSGIKPVDGEYSGSGLYYIKIMPGQLRLMLDLNSTIDVPENVVVGDEVIISGVVTDELGSIVGGIDLKVIVNGESEFVTTNPDGRWSVTYVVTNDSVVRVVVTFDGDNKYNTFTNESDFSAAMLDLNSTIDVPENVVVGDEVIVSGVVTDENDNVVGDFTLIVTIGNDEISVIVNPDGTWSFPYVPNHAGAFVVSVRWNGDNKYNLFTNESDFEVAINGNENEIVPDDVKVLKSTNTTVVASNVKVGQVVTITGVLTDENANILANVKLTVIVAGQTFTVNTNDNGEWSLQYTPKSSGAFVVSVKWTGDDDYFGFINSTTFNVAKLKTNSTIVVQKKVKVGQTVKINGVLTDENSRPVAHTLLTVSVNGKIYKVTTNSAGMWTLSYKVNKTGKVQVSVSYTGNDVYLSSKNNTNFNVVKGKINSKVDVIKNKNGSLTIKTIVTDDEGNPIKDQPVEIIVGGNIIGSGVTDENGIAVIILPSELVGKAKFSVAVNGIGVYYPYSHGKTFKMTVNDTITNNNTGSNKDLVTKSFMKNTGLPIIAILLMLLTFIGLGFHRKQK